MHVRAHTVSNCVSSFLQVVSSANDSLGGLEHVTKFNHYLSNIFAETAHESCVGVSNLICGHTWNFWVPCTLDDLYSYLGDNSYTKLKTDYIIGDDNVSPFVRADSDYMKTCNDFADWDR